jgi:tetratricopeptide (TPR) repeat protein
LAVHDLDILQKADPHSEDLLFLLAFAHLKNGDSDTAQVVFDQMFAVAGPARAQFLLGRACYEAALFPRAEESFKEVSRLGPNYPGLRLEVGKLYISQRRTEEAVRELKAALDENGRNEEANYFLGSLLVQETRYEEGIPYLERARQLRPDSWPIYFYLGRAKLRMQQTAEAIVLLQRAVDLNSEEASSEYQLARALQATGRKMEAARAFNRTRELNADAQSDIKIPGVR